MSQACEIFDRDDDMTVVLKSIVETDRSLQKRFVLQPLFRALMVDGAG